MAIKRSLINSHYLHSDLTLELAQRGNLR